jgi:predicted MFS family arabinose efflux permease
VAAPNRQVVLVSLLFAASFTIATTVVVSGSLVGAALSDDERLATLPISLGVVGGVGATWPASKAMARWGRRRGFQAATVVGLLGALLCAWAIQRGSFVQFCVGSLLIGTMAGVGQYYRFTAGEVADPADRERAFGVVLGGGVLGGVIGPPSAIWAADAFGARFTGTYLFVALIALLVLCALPFLRATTPSGPPSDGKRVRLQADRPFFTAVVAGVLAYGLMVLTMYAAPLSLQHHGHGDAVTAQVLQAHVIAMFLPSFVTGALVQRIGPGRGMAGGLLLFGACIGVNLAGSSVPHYAVALALLGLGWNLLFVAATALLARSHPGADKASAQGTNELLVGSAAAGAAFLAAPAHTALGWTGLNLAVGAVVCIGALALAALLRPARQPAAPPRPTA